VFRVPRPVFGFVRCMNVLVNMEFEDIQTNFQDSAYSEKNYILKFNIV